MQPRGDSRHGRPPGAPRGVEEACRQSLDHTGHRKALAAIALAQIKLTATTCGSSAPSVSSVFELERAERHTVRETY
jgi:hypothetical protein